MFEKDHKKTYLRKKPPYIFQKHFFSSETDILLVTTVTKKLIAACDYVIIIFWVYIILNVLKVTKKDFKHVSLMCMDLSLEGIFNFEIRF